jgi:serine/threonine protein phosphatase PrpC
MAGWTGSAGRPNNEDNIQLSDNLGTNGWSFNTNKEIVLSEKGCLLIVCDGMGGMNAGEVASAVAVRTIKEWFTSELLTDETLSSPDKIKRYIEKAIIAADTRIKSESRADKEKEGMGSTIVLAWVVKESVFVGWCGDSRIYRFNPNDGLTQLSHDHSYVQELVDAGKLSEDLAFDHPNNNIITRSLGDPSRTAKPDVKEYPLRNGDIIMLCSDGLSGVLRDNEIEEIIRNNSGNMEACREALWDASREAGWHDNVTIGLCQIIAGCKTNIFPMPQKNKPVHKPVKKWIMIAVAVVLFLVLIGGGFVYLQQNKNGLIKSVRELTNKYGQLHEKLDFYSKRNSTLEKLKEIENLINGSQPWSLGDYEADIDSIKKVLETQEIWRENLSDQIRSLPNKSERLIKINDSLLNKSQTMTSEQIEYVFKQIDDNATVISILPANLSFKYSGETKSITVEISSNTEWGAKSNEKWCKVKEDKKASKLEVICEKNNDTLERKCIIIVTANNKSEKINVVQSGKPKDMLTKYITINGIDYQVKEKKDNYYVEYQIPDGQGWDYVWIHIAKDCSLKGTEDPDYSESKMPEYIIAEIIELNNPAKHTKDGPLAGKIKIPYKKPLN